MNEISQILLENGLIHPARIIPYSILYENLNKEVELGYINVVYHPNFPQLALYKYTNKAVFDKHWNLYTLIARGLVLDIKEMEVIATPFIKFFNLNENFDYKDVFSINYTATEKVDGSLIVLFKFNNTWIATTAGGWQSEQSIWASNWISEGNLDLNKLKKGNTYLFESIYKENRIVVKYNFEGLVLLSIFKESGEECDYEEIKNKANSLNIRYIKRYNNFNTIEEIVKATESLKENEEGFVIKFDNGVRIKLKGAEYCRIHKLISNLTPLSVWENILYKKNLDEIKKQIPEEFVKDLENISKILYNNFNNVVEEIESFYQSTKHLEDKELGLLLQSNKKLSKRNEFKFAFSIRRHKFYEELESPGSSIRRSLMNLFKPKNNVLLGYRPTSAMNRFDDN